ncbi:MAG: hypothetical protein IJP30_02900 [Clostridia bacterium]|nr:hypothetical protein [Clostridia bacterium]
MQQNSFDPNAVYEKTTGFFKRLFGDVGGKIHKIAFIFFLVSSVLIGLAGLIGTFKVLSFAKYGGIFVFYALLVLIVTFLLIFLSYYITLLICGYGELLADTKAIRKQLESKKDELPSL